MQTEHWKAANSQTKPTNLTVNPIEKTATICIHHRHLFMPLHLSTSPHSTIAFLLLLYHYYNSAKKLIIYCSMEGGRVSQPRQYSADVQPCPVLYTDKHKLPTVRFKPGICQMLSLHHCNLLYLCPWPALCYAIYSYSQKWK